MVLKATVPKESPKQSLPTVTLEAVVRRCSSKQVFFEIFRNIHRKTFVLESRYNKFSGLHLKETSTQVFSCEYCTIFTNTNTVCNFQSRKSPVELNSLLSKLFCYITWLVISPDYRRHWTTCKRGLYVKSYCSPETIAQRIKEHSSYRTPPVVAFLSLIM